MEELAIKATDLKIGYKQTVIGGPYSFCVKEGCVTSMLGRNGVGKSTLLKTLIREIPSLGGKIELFGKDLYSYSQRNFARQIAIVTTDSIQAGGLKVEELVGLGRHPYTGFTGRLKNDDKEIVEASIRSVGIEHKIGNYYAELSDGEKQKVLIARALAQQTPMILLDEPFSFIDAAARISLMLLLRRLAETENKTVILSSHDVSQALRLSNQVIIFTDNRELYYGSPVEMITDKVVERMFDNKEVMFDSNAGDFLPKDI